MNHILAIFLKVLRKLYTRVFREQLPLKPSSEENAEIASQIIYSVLSDNKTCMIARFGAFELSTMVNYLGVQKRDRNIIRFIKGESIQWWWNQKTLYHMQNNTGFFPATEEKIARFCELMLNDMRQLDLLGSWLSGESYFENQLSKVDKVKLVLLEPYIATNPWTRYLKGKKVLVIHPFAHLIEAQYKKRDLLFDNPEVLPEFELKTIAAVQSIGGETNGFNDWFEALEWMKREINRHDYDICLIGCGAYGFPLAAHVKRQGKKAVHLGGLYSCYLALKGNVGRQKIIQKNGTCQRICIWIYLKTPTGLDLRGMLSQYLRIRLKTLVIGE